MRVGQQPVVGIPLEHLNHVVVSACHQQIFPVRRNVEVAWMNACLLVSYGSKSAFLQNREDGNAIVFCPIAGVQEAVVRTEVDVGAAS